MFSPIGFGMPFRRHVKLVANYLAVGAKHVVLVRVPLEEVHSVAERHFNLRVLAGDLFDGAIDFVEVAFDVAAAE